MLTTVAPSHRTREDWDALAEELLPEIQAEGGLTDEMRKRYNIGHVYRIKMALARLGFDIHGKAMHVKPIQAKRPAAVARQIATRRSKGEPYWLLEVEAGMSPPQMQRLMQEHGIADPAETSNGHS